MFVIPFRHFSNTTSSTHIEVIVKCFKDPTHYYIKRDGLAHRTFPGKVVRPTSRIFSLIITITRINQQAVDHSELRAAYPQRNMINLIKNV
jgi:hypothetical protein